MNETGNQIELGEIGGTKYRIEIPFNWNKGLVMHAHGYWPNRTTIWNNQLAYFTQKNATGITASRARGALSQGYAVAESAYSRAGLAIREGILDTEALRRYFVNTYEATYPTIMAGTHMGAFITYYMIHNFPDVYDGALALSGCGQPTLTNLKYFFDMRMVFDYYFPGLPGNIFKPREYNKSAMDMSNLQQRIKELMDTAPGRAEKFIKMWNMNDKNQAAYSLALYEELFQELIQQNGGNAFDNRNTIYRGIDGDSAELNIKISRHTSEKKAVEFLRQWINPNGNLIRPILSVNALYDPIVPVESLAYFEQLTQLVGTSEMYVQMWLDSASPDYTAEETAYLLNLLTEWIKKGKRPESGELKRLGTKRP